MTSPIRTYKLTVTLPAPEVSFDEHFEQELEKLKEPQGEVENLTQGFENISLQERVEKPN